MSAIESRYGDWLEARARAGLRRSLLSLAHDGSVAITMKGASFINFSSNDYLGLARHPLLVERARDWAERYGAGCAASRLVTGNIEPFERIEARVASLKGSEAALVMASGFQANGAVLQALFDKDALGAEPLVFADRLNHSSMHFGCSAAGVRQQRYRHCDADHLDTLLQNHAGDDRPKFILTESVFSMDGDIAPMERIIALAKAHEAFVICDDAHATGVLGAGGSGLSAGADMAIGTFSKALGSFGAYVASTKLMRDYLVNRCSGLIYSTALPPPVLGAVDAALDLVPGLDGERAHVAALAEGFRQQARALGYDTGASQTQIVPVIAGQAEDALALSADLADAGFWVTAIRPPTVPKGAARLRVAFSAAHSEQQTKALLDALAQATKAARASG